VPTSAARLTATVATAALLAVAAPPAAARAQDNCAPPGEAITPVPWPQQLFAPAQAWVHSTGAGQRVAVVSTGVADTPYLAGAVAEQVDLAPEPQFGEPSGLPDCLGIGTGAAGLIAAQRVDGVGFRGLAPDTRILDAKVVGDQFPQGQQLSGSIEPDLLASGINWAVEQGATVVVAPTITYQDSDALRSAVGDALDAGVVVVASVGEPGQEQDSPDDLTVVPYPAAYDGVIGVGAIAADGTAGLSRTGHVDLVAPGVEILTTYPGDGLGAATGTGYAAAYVAASVALVRAYRPGLSPEQVAHRLFATATPASEGVGSPRYGYGIVNPYQAILDRVVDGDPAALPPFAPDEPTGEELARQAARERSDALAGRLVIAGLALAAVLVAGVGFITRARRRRWRAGVAATPPERPEEDYPEPPRELFDANAPYAEDRR
jgi:hypothetical protein